MSKNGMSAASPLVSVIIPVYNVSEYLKRCIDSCLRQEFRNFELVFVDDGSTDGSSSIIRDALGHAPCSDIPWNILTQENGGLSAARNAGLRNACGKYVLFVDGDDLIHPQLLAKVVSIAETSRLDYVLFDHLTGWGMQGKWEFSNAEPVFRSSDAFEWFVGTRQSPSACRFLFKRDVLGVDPFIPRLIYEDNPFVYDFLNRNLRGAHLPLALYRYCLHEGSITRSSVSPAKVRSVDRIVRHLHATVLDKRRFRLLCRTVEGRLARHVVKRAVKGEDVEVKCAAQAMAIGLLREGLLKYSDFGLGWALRMLLLSAFAGRTLTHVRWHKEDGL